MYHHHRVPRNPDLAKHPSMRVYQFETASTPRLTPSDGNSSETGHGQIQIPIGRGVLLRHCLDLLSGVKLHFVRTPLRVTPLDKPDEPGCV